MEHEKANMKISFLSAIRLCAALTVVFLSGCVTDGTSLAFFQAKPEASTGTAIKPVAGSRPQIICKAAKGSAKFSSGWRDFAETQFELRDAERVRISVSARKSAETVAMIGFYDHDGQSILFCPVDAEAGPDGKIACSSLYALEEDLAMGIKRTFDVPKAVIGGSITCAYAVSWRFWPPLFWAFKLFQDTSHMPVILLCFDLELVFKTLGFQTFANNLQHHEGFSTGCLEVMQVCIDSFS